jgi:hypothetical protein
MREDGEFNEEVLLLADMVEQLDLRSGRSDISESFDAVMDKTFTGTQIYFQTNQLTRRAKISRMQRMLFDRLWRGDPLGRPCADCVQVVCPC